MDVFSIVYLINIRPNLLSQGFAAVKLSSLEQQLFKGTPHNCGVLIAHLLNTNQLLKTQPGMVPWFWKVVVAAAAVVNVYSVHVGLGPQGR